MLNLTLFVFHLLSLLTTKDDATAAKHHYSKLQIERRTMFQFPVRGFLDKTVNGKNCLYGLHESGYDFGLGYERILYFGVLDNRPKLFLYDHTDYIPRNYTIQSGIEP